MAIARFSLSADNFITNEYKYGSGGSDPILNIGAKYSTTSATNSRTLQRILGILDLSPNSDIQSKISNGYVPNPVTDSVTAKLKMFNVLHGQRQARNFYLDVYPVTSAWDEGYGTGFNDTNDLLITGYSNYVSRKPNVDWTTSGGDYLVDTNSATQYFNSGSEDLSVDITNMLKNWLSGVSSNYGFLIKLDDIYESACGSYSASQDLWRKSFFGRETRLLKWPRVELTWDNQIKDYRGIFTIGTSGYTYFYNISNGSYVDLSGTGSFPGYVVIEGSTAGVSWTSVSSSLSSLSAQRTAKGIYRALINELPYSLCSSYSYFRDKWIITSAISAISNSSVATINVISPFAFSNMSDVSYNNFVLNLRNFQNEYKKETIVTLRLFIKDLSKTYQTLTASSTTFSSEISDNGYWRVTTNLDVVDIDWQPLSFDKNGNFFTLDCSNLTRNINYKIDFKLKIKSQDLYFDGKDIPTLFRVI